MDNDLRNEIDVELNYWNAQGKKGVKNLHIAFISQAIYDEYTKVIEDTNTIVRLTAEIENKQKETGYIIAQRSKIALNEETGEYEVVGKKHIKDTIADLKQLKDEIEKTTEKVNGLSSTIRQRQLSLIHKILVRNGIEDEELLSTEWWMNSVDMTDVVVFLHVACTKDNQKILDKKKE